MLRTALSESPVSERTRCFFLNLLIQIYFGFWNAQSLVSMIASKRILQIYGLLDSRAAFVFSADRQVLVSGKWRKVGTGEIDAVCERVPERLR